MIYFPKKLIFHLKKEQKFYGRFYQWKSGIKKFINDKL